MKQISEKNLGRIRKELTRIEKQHIEMMKAAGHTDEAVAEVNRVQAQEWVDLVEQYPQLNQIVGG